MIGRLYDLAGRRAERGALGERRAELLADLEGDVLEVGAGTGASLPHYRRARRVVALEPSEDMAGRIPGRIEEARVPVEIVHGTAEDLPFPDETFDAAVVILVLCSVAEPGRALAEIRRVLRPGGKLVVLEHVRGTGRTARWQDRLTPLHRRVTGNCHLNRETRGTLAAAGFDVSAVAPTTLPHAHPVARPAVQGVATRTSS